MQTACRGSNDAIPPNWRRSGCVSGKVVAIWIGCEHPDSLFSYPDRRNLSGSSYPIRIVSCQVRDICVPDRRAHVLWRVFHVTATRELSSA